MVVWAPGLEVSNSTHMLIAFRVRLMSDAGVGVV